MKYIIIGILISLYSLSSFGNSNLKCSREGTTFLWINGIDTKDEEANDSLTLVWANVQNDQIDLKDLEFEYTYNQTISFKDDIQESISQELTLNYGIPEVKAFLASYFYTAYKSLSISDIISVLPSWQSQDLESINDSIDQIDIAEIQSIAVGNLQQ
jgi:hypothetical protein